MSAFIDSYGFVVLFKGVMALGLAIAGITLLVQDFRQRVWPVRAQAQPSGMLPRLTQRTSVHTRSLPLKPLAVRLQPQAQLARLTSVIETASGRLDTIRGAQSSASVQIDAAEHALNRLMGEIKGVMPVVMAPPSALPPDLMSDVRVATTSTGAAALAA